MQITVITFYQYSTECMSTPIISLNGDVQTCSADLHRLCPKVNID